MKLILQEPHPKEHTQRITQQQKINKQVVEKKRLNIESNLNPLESVNFVQKDRVRRKGEKDNKVNVGTT